MMGIPYDESFIVAELIGTKLFLNEFLAYEKLAELKKNRLDGLDEVLGGVRQWISVSGPFICRCGEIGIISVWGGMEHLTFENVCALFYTHCFGSVVSVQGSIGSYLHVRPLWIRQLQLIGHCDRRPVYV